MGYQNECSAYQRKIRSRQNIESISRSISRVSRVLTDSVHHVDKSVLPRSPTSRKNAVHSPMALLSWWHLTNLYHLGWLFFSYTRARYVPLLPDVKYNQVYRVCLTNNSYITFLHACSVSLVNQYVIIHRVRRRWSNINKLRNTVEPVPLTTCI